MHVTAQSTNLDSVPAKNKEQQSSTNNFDSIIPDSNSVNQNKSTSILATKVRQQQDGTTNLDDEVSALLFFKVYVFLGIFDSPDSLLGENNCITLNVPFFTQSYAIRFLLFG